MENTKNDNNETLLIIQHAVRLGFEFEDIQEIQDIRFAAEEFIEEKESVHTPGEKVKFKVLKIEDARKQGSEVEIGAEFKGEISSNLKEIYFTDKANCEWVFYIGDTCELVN